MCGLARYDPCRPTTSATMYADFYGLQELPFNVTPDPRFLYLNNCYQEALAELGVPPEGGRKLVLFQRLNEFLIEHTASGGNVALLIDEAQDLRPKVLEELRLLSNLETAREKILQIVLAGQPELDRILADT